MNKNHLFDLVQKANPKDPLQQAVSSLNDPYDMARFYAGYAQHLMHSDSIIMENLQTGLGIGSVVCYRLNPDEVYKFARERILQKAEEQSPDTAKNWKDVLEREDLKLIARMIKANLQQDY